MHTIGLSCYFTYLLKFVPDEASSDCCHLSVSPSSTAAEVIRHFLDAKNIDDEQRLYSLIAVPTVDSESTGMHCICHRTD